MTVEEKTPLLNGIAIAYGFDKLEPHELVPMLFEDFDGRITKAEFDRVEEQLAPGEDPNAKRPRTILVVPPLE